MTPGSARIAGAPVGLRWLATIAFAALLVVLSVTPGSPEAGDGAFHWLVVNTATPLQKALHLVAYGALAILLAWSLGGRTRRPVRLGIALVAAVALGAGLEWWQLRVPGRFGNVFDILLNTAGALAGVMLSAVFDQRRSA